MASPPRWLLLVHQVPPKPDYLRVKIRRRLHRIGAVPLKNTVYVLPRSDPSLEDFQWVMREIAEAGGQGAICEASVVAGVSDAEIEGLFRAARKDDYAELARAATDAAAALPRDEVSADDRREAEAALARMKGRLEEIRAIDFGGGTDASAIERALHAIETRLTAPSAEPKRGRAALEHPRGRTWVTRKGVYVDRIASAWLIRRFIDPKAKFRFVSGREPKRAKGELRFDMFDGEYTHEGDRCTFEVLLARFALDDRALGALAEIVHDLDMKDGKFRREETSGVEKVIAGIAMGHQDDADRIERGSAVLDDLHAFFTRKTPVRRKAGARE